MDKSQILGLSVGVVSLIFAIWQMFRIRKLKKEENADIWLTIRTINHIFHCIDESGEKKKNIYVARAYESAVGMFRTQLKRAVMNERNFSIQTIDKWMKIKKLRSEWQKLQALSYLDTKSIQINNHGNQSKEKAK